MENKMFNLKKYSQVIKPTEKMLIDNNKKHDLSPTENTGSYEYLLKDVRKNDNLDVIYEKLSNDARKDAKANAESKGTTGDVITEKVLNKAKDTFNPTRTDDKDKIPLMDYSKEAENDIRDKFVKENKKDDRDTEFWDKFIGVQLTDDKTTITSNSQTSQLISNFESRKEMNKENPMIDKPKKDISKVAQTPAVYPNQEMDKIPDLGKREIWAIKNSNGTEVAVSHYKNKILEVYKEITKNPETDENYTLWRNGKEYPLMMSLGNRVLGNEIIDNLKTADAMLYHIYKTANGRDLTEKENQMITDINGGKIRTIAQFYGDDFESEYENDITDDMGDEDRSMFADPGGSSDLRTGKREFPCPTCGEPNRLTLKDVQLGYQCDTCADIAEGRFGKSKENIKEGQYLDENEFEDVGVDNIPFDGDEEKIEDRDMEGISSNPQEDDIIIGKDDLSAYYSGKKIISVNTPEELRPAIKVWMDKELFFPDVWVISDHGNPLNVTEDVMKSTAGPEFPNETPEWLAEHEHTGFASMKTRFSIKEGQFSPAEADHEIGSENMLAEGDMLEEKKEIEQPKVEEKPIQYAVEYNNGTSWIRLNNGKLFDDAGKAGLFMQRQIDRMTKVDKEIRHEDLISKLKIVPVRESIA
jgi:hypothetical protein